ncbi:hypothetical protein WN51_00031 [Melipona quadrifasciata]|uniref:Uncharacterized protein n=1 Tax=Melipona quadrifasciata TaxID=166423 RepID=A0A0M8ZMJ0_9HYME|nr:hypothetical protein WN51_00031 [Melipona quadrifasciata]
MIQIYKTFSNTFDIYRSIYLEININIFHTFSVPHISVFVKLKIYKRNLQGQKIKLPKCTEIFRVILINHVHNEAHSPIAYFQKPALAHVSLKIFVNRGEDNNVQRIAQQKKRNPPR